MDATPVRWAGLNHLALITDDMDTTTRFWHGVLGAPLVATIGTAAFRHYFFDVGHGATVAFFEYQGYTYCISRRNLRGGIHLRVR